MARKKRAASAEPAPASDTDTPVLTKKARMEAIPWANHPEWIDRFCEYADSNDHQDFGPKLVGDSTEKAKTEKRAKKVAKEAEEVFFGPVIKYIFTSDAVDKTWKGKYQALPHQFVAARHRTVYGDGRTLLRPFRAPGRATPYRKRSTESPLRYGPIYPSARTIYGRLVVLMRVVRAGKTVALYQRNAPIRDTTTRQWPQSGPYPSRIETRKARGRTKKKYTEHKKSLWATGNGIKEGETSPNLIAKIKEEFPWWDTFHHILDGVPSVDLIGLSNASHGVDHRNNAAGLFKSFKSTPATSEAGEDTIRVSTSRTMTQAQEEGLKATDDKKAAEGTGNGKGKLVDKKHKGGKESGRKVKGGKEAVAKSKAKGKAKDPKADADAEPTPTNLKCGFDIAAIEAAHANKMAVSDERQKLRLELELEKTKAKRDKMELERRRLDQQTEQNRLFTCPTVPVLPLDPHRSLCPSPSQTSLHQHHAVAR
uniref:Uncharacterized protein n=1 Tax=Mycena chlorophos TaxID=658473 RepID=A0ABQ0KWV0_MYCCL|nr:predicted protein [Mycena chlorophos]